jgi:hypothetical protein
LEADSNHRIGRRKENGVRRWKTPEEEEGKVRRDTDNRDPHVSGSGRKNAAAAGRERARDDGPSGRDLGSAQEEKEAAGGREKRPACAGLRREAAQEQRENKKSFSQFFKFLFQKIFKSKFKFKSNHSSQKFKCNSMSAQTCFYSYI